MIADGHKFTDERVGLNSAFISNGNTLLNFYERTNEDIVTNRTFIHIYWFYHDHIFTKMYIADLNAFKVRFLHSLIIGDFDWLGQSHFVVAIAIHAFILVD